MFLCVLFYVFHLHTITSHLISCHQCPELCSDIQFLSFWNIIKAKFTSVVLTQLSCCMFLTIQTYQFTASWFTVCQFGLFRPLKTNTHNSFLLWGSNTSTISIIPIPFLSYQYLLYWNQLPYPLRPITFTIDIN